MSIGLVVRKLLARAKHVINASMIARYNALGDRTLVKIMERAADIRKRVVPKRDLGKDRPG
jgi:hypothetical protein